MGRPGWQTVDVDSTGEPSLDEAGQPVPTGAIHELPVAPQYGATPGLEDSDIDLTTEQGKRWVYKQFSRESQRIPFRFTEPDYAAFEALHLAVGGQDRPFLYYPDAADTATFLFCRKEKDFLPRELDQPGAVDRIQLSVWDYELVLTAEPASLEILP